MASKKTPSGFIILYWGAVICSIGGLLSIMIAFASPYWIKSWTRVHSPLANTGLWQICLSGYIKPRDPSLRAYVGCWWIHTSHFDDISSDIMPAWFRVVQGLVVITFILFAIVTLLIIFFRVEGIRAALYRDNEHRLLFIDSALLFAAALLVLVDSFLFAMKAKDPTWMPRPHLNWLSFSYGCNVLSGFFGAFGGICIFLVAMIVKEGFEEEEEEPPMKLEVTREEAIAARERNKGQEAEMEVMGRGGEFRPVYGSREQIDDGPGYKYTDSDMGSVDGYQKRYGSQEVMPSPHVDYNQPYQRRQVHQSQSSDTKDTEV